MVWLLSRIYDGCADLNTRILALCRSIEGWNTEKWALRLLPKCSWNINFFVL